MRLDKYLVENGLVKSRTRAAELIKDGKVFCGGEAVCKVSYEVPEGCDVTISGEQFPYVGRGALKLLYALDTFGVSPEGLVCADVGASTGGFTEVLLKQNAKKVYAIDSGHGQLDDSLRRSERVVSLEGFNAKQLSPEALGETCDMAVCDVSFISQTLLHSPIRSILKDSGVYVGLVKPQFELSREMISKGGIVKSAEHRFAAAKRVYLSLISNGFSVKGFCASPVTGGDGNIEFLLLASAASDDPTVTLDDIERIVFNENRNSSKKG